MRECPVCGFEAKTGGGLASHRRSHASESNRAAVEQTIAELRRMGRLEDVDAALVQAARTLARVMDTDPNGSVAKEYMAAIKALREAGTDDHDDLDQLIDRLRAPMGDPPD